MEKMMRDLHAYKPKKANIMRFTRKTLNNANKFFRPREMIIIAFEYGESDLESK